MTDLPPFYWPLARKRVAACADWLDQHSDARARSWRTLVRHHPAEFELAQGYMLDFLFNTAPAEHRRGRTAFEHFNLEKGLAVDLAADEDPRLRMLEEAVEYRHELARAWQALMKAEFAHTQEQEAAD